VLARDVWHERVDRRLRRPEHARDHADAVRAFLTAVGGHEPPEPALWLDGKGPMTEIEARAMRELMDEPGRITGVGPFP
jgi:hypothetical protein